MRAKLVGVVVIYTGLYNNLQRTLNSLESSESEGGGLSNWAPAAYCVRASQAAGVPHKSQHATHYNVCEYPLPIEEG